MVLYEYIEKKLNPSYYLNPIRQRRKRCLIPFISNAYIARQ